MCIRIRIDATIAVLLAVVLTQTVTAWSGFMGGAALTLFTLLRWKPANSVPTAGTVMEFFIGPIVLTVLAEKFVAETLKQGAALELWGPLAAVSALAAIVVTSHFAKRAKVNYRPPNPDASRPCSGGGFFLLLTSTAPCAA